MTLSNFEKMFELNVCPELVGAAPALSLSAEWSSRTCSCNLCTQIGSSTPDDKGQGRHQRPEFPSRHFISSENKRET